MTVHTDVVGAAQGMLVRNLWPFSSSFASRFERSDDAGRAKTALLLNNRTRRAQEGMVRTHITSTLKETHSGKFFWKATTVLDRSTNARLTLARLLVRSFVWCRSTAEESSGASMLTPTPTAVGVQGSKAHTQVSRHLLALQFIIDRA